MESLWSMSTTVREAERILGFLKVAKLMEGETWNDEGQFKFQVLLVQHREYLNDPSNGQTFQKLNAKQIEYLINPELDIPYEIAESIIKSKLCWWWRNAWPSIYGTTKKIRVSFY